LSLFSKKNSYQALIQTLVGVNAKLGEDHALEHRGTTYTVNLRPQVGNQPPHLKVSIPSPEINLFRVKLESSFDSFSKKIGLSKEFQTGDKLFDERHYLVCDNEVFAANYFGSVEKREAIANIISNGFIEVGYNEKENTLEALWPGYRVKDETDVGFIHDTVENLDVLRRDVRPVPALNDRPITWVPVSLSIIVSVVGMAAIFFVTGSYDLLDWVEVTRDSLSYSVPALLFFLYVFFLALRGRSKSHHHFAIVLFLSLLGFITGGVAGLAGLNVVLDENPAKHFEQLVLEKKSVQVKGGKKYYVTVKSWRADQRGQKIRVERGLYNAVVSQQDYLSLEVRPGHYGYEWLESFKLIKK
jgi:hypothetical protein